MATTTCWIAPDGEGTTDDLSHAACGAMRGNAAEPGGRAPTLDGWFLELIAADVAWLADCESLWRHHRTGFEAALGNASHAAQMIEGIKTNNFGLAFAKKHAAMLRYVGKLAVMPQAMVKADVNALRAAGAGDDEILDVCLAVADAAYRVRLVRGLGIVADDGADG